MGRSSVAESLGKSDPRWRRNFQGDHVTEQTLAGPLMIDGAQRLTLRKAERVAPPSQSASLGELITKVTELLEALRRNGLME